MISCVVGRAICLGPILWTYATAGATPGPVLLREFLGALGSPPDAVDATPSARCHHRADGVAGKIKGIAKLVKAG